MTRVRIKICGITDASGVDAAVEAGADAVGFVFAESARRLFPSDAIPLVSRVPPFVTSVAVFRYPTPAEIEEVVRQVRPDIIQVEPSPPLFELARRHGWRILPVIHDEPDWDHQLTHDGLFLLEGRGRGGRGVKPDWERAAVIARARHLVLAGGLTPVNVGDAIRRVRPWAVDVSSGVESTPGIKDADRIRAFIDAVRQAEQHLHPTLEALS